MTSSPLLLRHTPHLPRPGRSRFCRARARPPRARRRASARGCRSRRSCAAPMTRGSDVVPGLIRAQQAASRYHSARRLLIGARVATCGMPRHRSARRRPSGRAGPSGYPVSFTRRRTRRAGTGLTRTRGTTPARARAQRAPGGAARPDAGPRAWRGTGQRPSRRSSPTNRAIRALGCRGPDQKLTKPGLTSMIRQTGLNANIRRGLLVVRRVYSGKLIGKAHGPCSRLNRCERVDCIGTAFQGQGTDLRAAIARVYDHFRLRCREGKG